MVRWAPYSAKAADSSYVLAPDSLFSRRWDMVMALLLVFVALVTPFELGFLTTDTYTASGLALFIMNRVVDLVFLVDIFIQSNTGFTDVKGYKVFFPSGHHETIRFDVARAGPGVHITLRDHRRDTKRRQ